ncbi:hypothetical protein MUK42_25421 [Musa troglodytarum]|uniref:C2H2-type domain-containing protein n=1 Tax=Musa troglodytarum TaxID=320322 RepID=A0A9E7ICX3_9LILI|nr:hypothetical protein MUK42_25421 [Musa troglodytarum]
MAVPACGSCNNEFEAEAQQKLHRRSQWHRYNLKRKVAGVPGVPEESFQARRSALAETLSATPSVTGVGSFGLGITTIKPLAESEESEVGWIEVHPNDKLDVACEYLSNLHVGEDDAPSDEQNDDIDKVVDLDASCCFICDFKYESIESCMVHMQKKHGFFIPDVEYLKDPKGLLLRVGISRARTVMIDAHPFQSLEAVRKHMIAKGHCKLRYGDGGDDEDSDLEDFYDYSSSYVDEDGKQLVISDDMSNNVELGSGGPELIIRRKTENGDIGNFFVTTAKRLCISPFSGFKRMDLATVQLKEKIVRMRVLREMNRHRVEAMCSKIGMKRNIIRDLPRNVSPRFVSGDSKSWTAEFLLGKSTV